MEKLSQGSIPLPRVLTMAALSLDTWRKITGTGVSMKGFVKREELELTVNDLGVCGSQVV